ncbi:hypothetical protein VNO80_05677 [Phaseolus coccineus]|uniref:Uncharacterized protein n=1 Tax=Phaseolus coccineus TaxID=3886 RepID=A0AAN9RIA4_PHACN
MELCENNSLESTLSGAKNEEKGCAAAPKLNGEGKSKVRDADGKLSIASVFERSMVDDLKSVQPGTSKGRPVEKNELRKFVVATVTSSSVAESSTITGSLGYVPKFFQSKSINRASQARVRLRSPTLVFLPIFSPLELDCDLMGL